MTTTHEVLTVQATAKGVTVRTLVDDHGEDAVLWTFENASQVGHAFGTPDILALPGKKVRITFEVLS